MELSDILEDSGYFYRLLQGDIRLIRLVLPKAQIPVSMASDERFCTEV